MPECTVISQLKNKYPNGNIESGEFSCVNDKEPTGDHSICCTAQSSPNVGAPGNFTCSETATFGTNVAQPWSPETEPMC
eukprot:15340690-Ditylum_brightwellii.AAC.1